MTLSPLDSINGAVASGEQMHGWVRDLFPICRSLTGPGVRDTLAYLGHLLPELQVESVPSHTRAFDWSVPDEWTIRDAYVADECGRRVIDFRAHNLHVVGYSVPVDRWLTLDELQAHLHSRPDLPEAIPYVTSYYKRQWGFCLSETARQRLTPGRYRAVIDSDLKPGVMNYAQAVLSGRSTREVLISTYICHPSMANNELSGPAVVTALGRWLRTVSPRKYTYRLVYVPETIGAIAYIAQHLDHLKAATIAGFQVTCIGDDRAYSYLPSRHGNTLADQVALHVLRHLAPAFRRFAYHDRGSDERQYCAPGVDLPVVSMMRSKYHEFPEYHTSLDDLSLVTPEGLAGGLLVMRRAIEALEANIRPIYTVLCEPQLGKRGLYPDLSTVGSSASVAAMMDILAYSDGTRTLLDIAELIGLPIYDVAPIVKRLLAHDLLADADFVANS